MRLGQADDSLVKSFKSHLDRLIQCREFGVQPTPDLMGWIFSMGDKLHANLLQAGLVDPRGPNNLSGLLDAHLQSLVAQGRKESTLCNNRVVHRNLIKFFGAQKRLDAITIPDAERFFLHLNEAGGEDGGPLAEATVSNRIRRARGAFAYAIKNQWLQRNPFASVSTGSERNEAKDHYVTPEVFEKILSFTAEKELALLLALVRYCGLRCPSEVTPLRWSAVDWQGGVLVVYSPKLRNFQPRREVPIFKAAAKYLNDYWDSLEPGPNELMFPRHQLSGAAISNRLLVLCRKAGETMWYKPMTNMRASCVRDLYAAEYPVDSVSHWLGHSATIALKHYSRIIKERQSRGALRGDSGAIKAKRQEMFSLVPLRFPG